METWWVGNEVTTGDLAGGEWRQQWRLRGWGFEMTVETRPRGNGDDSGDLVGGE